MTKLVTKDIKEKNKIKTIQNHRMVLSCFKKSKENQEEKGFELEAKREIEHLKTKLKDLERESSEYNAELRSKDYEIINLKERIEELSEKDENEESVSEKLALLEEQLNEQRKINEALERRLKGFKFLGSKENLSLIDNEMENLKKEYQKEKNINEDLRLQMTELVKELTSHKSKKKEGILTSISDLNEESRQKLLDKHCEEKKAIELEWERKTAKIESELNEKITKMQKDLDLAEARNAKFSLKQASNDASTQITELEQQLKRKQEMIQRLHSELDLFQEKLQPTERKVEELEMELQKKTLELEEKSRLILNLQKTENVSSQLSSVIEERNECLKRIEEMKLCIESLEKRNEGEIESMKQEIETQLAEERQEMQMMKQIEIDSLRAALEARGNKENQQAILDLTAEYDGAMNEKDVEISKLQAELNSVNEKYKARLMEQDKLMAEMSEDLQQFKEQVDQLNSDGLLIEQMKKTIEKLQEENNQPCASCVAKQEELETFDLLLKAKEQEIEMKMNTINSLERVLKESNDENEKREMEMKEYKDRSELISPPPSAKDSPSAHKAEIEHLNGLVSKIQTELMEFQERNEKLVALNENLEKQLQEQEGGPESKKEKALTKQIDTLKSKIADLEAKNEKKKAEFEAEKEKEIIKKFDEKLKCLAEMELKLKDFESKNALLTQEYETLKSKSAKHDSELSVKSKMLQQYILKEQEWIKDEKYFAKAQNLPKLTSAKAMMGLDPKMLSEINSKLQDLLQDLTVKNFELQSQVEELRK